MDFTRLGYQSDDETTEALLSDDGGVEVSHDMQLLNCVALL